MSSDKTVDILARGEEFHRRLAQFYRELSHRVTSERAKLALEFLEQHESALESTTRQYVHVVPHPMSDRWFKYSPNEELEKLLQTTEVPSDIRMAQLSELAHHLSDCITRYYKQFAETAVPEPLAEAFEKLLEMELEGQKKMTRALQESP